MVTQQHSVTEADMEIDITINIRRVSPSKLPDIVAGITGTDLNRQVQVEVGMDGDSAIGQFGERREKFLRAHPSIRTLLNEFVSHVQANLPDAHFTQNSSTITITMPGGLQTGLRLRTDGLKLTCWRGNKVTGKHETWIRSATDFNSALTYLENLPPYS